MTNATSSPPVAAAPPAVATADPASQRAWWAAPVIVAAVATVVIAFGFGVHGLLENPVVAVDSAGVTTLRGSFEPFPCSADAPGCTQGYVQSGARSVFVVFPHGCPNPRREQEITVRATSDRSLGNGSYRSIGCGQPG